MIIVNNEDKLIETLADAFSGLIVRHTPEEREEVAQSEVEYCWDIFGEYGLNQLLKHREYDLAKFREMKYKCQNAQEIRDIRIVLPDYLANYYKYYEVTWRYTANNEQKKTTNLYFPKEDENLIARVCRIVMPSDEDKAFLVHYNKIMRVAHDLKWIFNRGRHYNPSAVGLVPVRTN